MVIEITGLFSGMDNCNYPGVLMEPFDSPDMTKNNKSSKVTCCLVLRKEKKEKTRVFHSVVATLQSVQLKRYFFYINTINSIVCVTSARYFFFFFLLILNFFFFCKIKSSTSYRYKNNMENSSSTQAGKKQ